MYYHLTSVETSDQRATIHLTSGSWVDSTQNYTFFVDVLLNWVNSNRAHRSSVPAKSRKEDHVLPGLPGAMGNLFNKFSIGSVLDASMS